MASKIKNHSPTNFSSLMEIIEEFQDRHDVSWYRGCGKANYKLTPTLYRHPSAKIAEELAKMEREISSVFAQRCRPFVSQSFSDEWDKLFFMQHYGIPTRLLDWTESPFVALYFALTTCPRSATGKADADASIWLLNPASWNKGALNDISYPGGVLDSGREQVKSFSPSNDLDQRKNMPIMIYGTHNSPRIVAQRGMFALFGKSTSSMESQYDSHEFEKDILEKVLIKKQYIDDIARSLFRKGISDSTVYPDLTGLSLELRRSFGF